MRRSAFSVALCATLCVLGACSSSKTTTTAESETKAAEISTAPELVTAKTAFWKMYTPAKKWASDAEPLTIQQEDFPGVKAQDGKSAMWTTTFGSRSLKQARTFTYATAASGHEIYKGATVGNSITWAGPTRAAMTFQTDDLKVDSDDAVKAAAKDASAWLEKHPGDQPTSVKLGNASEFPAPVWLVIYGNDKEGYRALINANTGDPVGKAGKARSKKAA